MHIFCFDVKKGWLIRTCLFELVLSALGVITWFKI